MLLIKQNSLSKPEVVNTPQYEEQLKRFKRTLIDYVKSAHHDLAGQFDGQDSAAQQHTDEYREQALKLAQRLEQTLDNEAEILTKLVEVCALILQTRIREINQDALQMFAYWAQGANLDAVVSNLGLQRQTVKPATDQQTAELESDEQLRQRYFLAPFSFSSAGPALAYKYHAMTLGERPTITIQSPQVGKVVVGYQFDRSAGGQVKDANAQRTAPGEVLVTLLSHHGDGQADAALLAQAEQYLKREDIAPATDRIRVQSAEIVPYQIKVVAYIQRGPDTSLIHKAAKQQLQFYCDSCHLLGQSVELSRLYHALHQAGVSQIELQQPQQSIHCQPHQAPFCQCIDIEIRSL